MVRIWNPHDIKMLRFHVGMTQEQFAEELWVRKATVVDWETGKKRPVRSSRRMLSELAARARFPLKDTP